MDSVPASTPGQVRGARLLHEWMDFSWLNKACPFVESRAPWVGEGQVDQACSSLTPPGPWANLLFPRAHFLIWEARPMLSETPNPEGVHAPKGLSFCLQSKLGSATLPSLIGIILENDV